MANETVKQPQFSKSRLTDAALCTKKLYLQMFHKDLAVVSAKSQTSFDIGNEIGEIAKDIYGTPDAVEIEFCYPMEKMLEESRHAMVVREAIGKIRAG